MIYKDPVKVYEELYKVRDALEEVVRLKAVNVVSRDFRRTLYGLGEIAIKDYKSLPEEEQKRFEFDISALEKKMIEILGNQSRG